MVWVVWLRQAMGRHGRFENLRIGPWLSNRIESEQLADSNRIEFRSSRVHHHRRRVTHWVDVCVAWQHRRDGFNGRKPSCSSSWPASSSTLAAAATTTTTRQRQTFSVSCIDCAASTSSTRQWTQQRRIGWRHRTQGTCIAFQSISQCIAIIILIIIMIKHL